jgi:hypothetical protein
MGDVGKWCIIGCILGAWETWDEKVLVHHMLHYEIHL